MLKRFGSSKGFLIIYFLVAFCIVLFLAPTVYDIFKFKLPAQSTVASFVKKMSVKDFEGAYSLYSQETKQRLQLSNLESVAYENKLESYKSLSFQNFHLLAAMSGHPELPPFTAKVDGIVFYKDNTTRPFKAVLVMENEHWVIESVKITSTASQP